MMNNLYSYLAKFFHLRNCCRLVILLMVLCAMTSNAQSRVVVSNPLSNGGLIIETSSSPDFEYLLNDMLGADAVSAAKQFLPVVAIIENNTGRYIWGFTLIYTFPERISPSGRAWQYQISPWPGGAALRDRMLEPGAKYLVTPVSDFTASVDRSGKVTQQPNLDEGMIRSVGSYLSQHLDSNEKLVISIDSVIFEDGLIQGPDTAGRLDQVNDRILADRETVKAVESLEGNALRSRLLEFSGAGRGDDHSWRLTDNGRRLLSVLNTSGEAEVKQNAKAMKGTSWFPGSGLVRRITQ